MTFFCAGVTSIALSAHNACQDTDEGAGRTGKVGRNIVGACWQTPEDLCSCDLFQWHFEGILKTLGPQTVWHKGAHLKPIQLMMQKYSLYFNEICYLTFSFFPFHFCYPQIVTLTAKLPRERWRSPWRSTVRKTTVSESNMQKTFAARRQPAVKSSDVSINQILSKANPHAAVSASVTAYWSSRRWDVH